MAAPTFRFYSLSSPTSCPTWLVWLLCLCAWRGPMPVVHAHDLHQAESIEMAHHLERFHQVSNDRALGNQWFGHLSATALEEPSWHLHFVLPEGQGPASEDDSDANLSLTHPGQLPELQSSDNAMPLNGLASMAGPWHLDSVAWGIHLPRVNAAQPVPEIWHPRLSAQTLLCVVRC